MTVPLAMQDARLRRYPLRRHVLHAAGGPLSIVAPHSSQELLRDEDRARRCARGAPMPYWADIWASSVGLARHLLRGPGLAGQRVVDLGCGIGVGGTAAGRHGAEVLFLDLDPDALPFAGFNAEQNGVARHEERVFDWNRESLPQGCDLLLLADVAYEPKNHPGLLRQVERALADDGRVLSVDPFRSAADRFVQSVHERFPCTEETAHVHFDDRRQELRLLHIGGDAR